MSRSRAVKLLSAVLAIAGLSLAARADEAGSRVEFNRDIRPVLADKCFACHGPDKNTRKAKLRLDVREDALTRRDDGAAIVPGQPGESLLMARILTSDEDDLMPPPETHKPLSAVEKDLFQRWIAQGAEYQGHWAFQPLLRPAPPQVRGRSAALRNPIDAFIQERLARTGLKPSPEADRTTLIRRLAFDLHGLPPSPEQVDRLVRSRDPQAYEKLVEEMLGSPRYAERMTMQWLDLVRYADSIGFHGDCTISVWPYRDYVLRAFHENVPFDQFTREQLAGDLLPDATDAQKVASGYNRLLRVSTEGGVQDKEYRAKYMADRVRTTSAIWLGATTGCAECHDHKFDPITTRDFYSLAAFFADLNEKGFYDKGFSENDWGPKLLLPSPEQKARLAELDAAIEQAKQAIDAVPDAQLAAARGQWETDVLAADKAGTLEWRTQAPLSAATQHGATLTIQDDKWITATGTNPNHEIYTVTFKPGPGRITAVRLNTGADESFPGNRIARGGTSFVLTGVEIEAAAAGSTRALKIAHATANEDGDGFPVLATLDDDPKTGWGITSGHSRECQAVFRLTEPLVADADTTVTIRLRHESDLTRCTIAKLRLAVTGQERPLHDRFTIPEDTLKVIRKPAAERSGDDQKKIVTAYRRVAAELDAGSQRLARLKAQHSLLAAQIPSTLVSQATTPRTMRILPRGNWMDDSGEIVQPAVPAFLGRLDTGTNRATRLDLANWLVSPENPLTARAFVNRLWKQFFGAGFSKTPEDLGAQGEWPTHPELLDWLASEFRQPTAAPREGRSTSARPAEHAWDVKHLIRLIVTSHTYRQSSLASSALAAKDPDNRLLARQNRFRVDAEVVRDNALAISGLLVEKVGGPSVRPYQPDGYWAPLNFPKREYVNDAGENLYRRGLYTHWQRTFLHPSLLAFDAPSREECTVNRVNSNTPLQALVLLNDPIYTEAARVFAEQALRQGGQSRDKQLAWAWQRALSRPPERKELALLRALHDAEAARFARDEAAALDSVSVGTWRVPHDLKPAELAAMTSVTRALLNLHATITRN